MRRILIYALCLLLISSRANALSNPPNCPTNGGSQALNYSTAINAYSCNPITTGTVTSVSCTPQNGVSCSVTNPTTTPALAFTLGVITPTTVNGLTFTSQSTGFSIAGGTTPKTFTLGGNLTTSGSSDATFVITGTTNVTFPTSGTLATTDSLIIGTSLTSTNPHINGDLGSGMYSPLGSSVAIATNATQRGLFNSSGLTVTGNTSTTGQYQISGVQISASNLSNGTTGSGSIVLATTPTLVTPVLGVASATSINKVAITTPATGSTLTIADGKTLTQSNTLTYIGTDGSTIDFGSGGTVLYSGGTSGVYLGTSLTAANPQRSGDTGTGLYTPAGSTVSIVTNATERLRIDSSGNVGIGTTANGTNAKLAVNGGAAFGSYGGNASSAPSNGLIISGSVGIGTATATSTTQIQANSIGATASDTSGILLQNNTAAAAGAQQVSPSITWEGQGWKTASTAASQRVKFQEYVLPVQGSNNPTGTWTLASSINGASYNTLAQVSSDGGLTLRSAVNQIIPFTWVGSDSRTGTLNLNGTLVQLNGSFQSTVDGPASSARFTALSSNSVTNYFSLFDDNAAGVMAQRNSTNAQIYRLYNTRTDSSNYERGVLDWQTTSNVLRIGTEAAGTGTVRNISLVGGSVGIGTTSPSVSLDLSQKTDAISVPSGTTGTRPATGINGMLRYSQTNNAVEAYTNNAWSSLITTASGVTTTGSPANGNLTQFSGATTITNGNLSGDVTTSGTLATTVAKVNGVTYPSSPSTGTIPLVTSSNTITYTNAASAGASLVLIGTASASSSASVSFSSVSTTGCAAWVVEFNDVRPATDATTFTMRISTGGSVKSGASDYAYALWGVEGGGASGAGAANTASSIFISQSGLMSSSGHMGGTIRIANPEGTTYGKDITFSMFGLGTGPSYRSFTGGGSYIGGTTALDGLQFIESSGNLTTGNFSLYCEKNQ